jgi:hypothetical protein
MQPAPQNCTFQCSGSGQNADNDNYRRLFKNGSYPGSALITVTNFARPGFEIEIQAVGMIGDSCSADNLRSAEGKAKKAQNK